MLLLFFNLLNNHTTLKLGKTFISNSNLNDVKSIYFMLTISNLSAVQVHLLNTQKYPRGKISTIMLRNFRELLSNPDNK